MNNKIVKACRLVVVVSAMVGLLLNVAYGNWLGVSLNLATLVAVG